MKEFKFEGKVTGLSVKESEDVTRAMEAEVEKVAKDFSKKVDDLVKEKEKEITSL